MVDLLVIEATRTTGATYQLKNGASCSMSGRSGRNRDRADTLKPLGKVLQLDRGPTNY